MQLFHFLKDYFYFVYELGIVSLIYALLIPLTFLMIIMLALTGYSGRLMRGSTRTLRFFKERAWVDNSNFGKFVNKCVKRFPYNLRVNFNLYANSERPLTDFFLNKFPKDYFLREKAYKYVYDIVVFGGGILVFFHIMNEAVIKSLIDFMLLPLIGLVFRYALSLILLSIEMRCRKVYLKAMDVMNNGIFLVRKREDAEDVNCKFVDEDEEYEKPAETLKKNFNNDSGGTEGNLEPLTADVGQTH